MEDVFEFDPPEWIDFPAHGSSNADGREEVTGFPCDTLIEDHHNSFTEANVLSGVGGDVGLCLLGGLYEEGDETLVESGGVQASPVPQVWSPGLSPADGGDARAPTSAPNSTQSKTRRHSTTTPESSTCAARSRAKAGVGAQGAADGASKRKTSQDDKARGSSEEADELDVNGVKLIMGRKPRERYDFGEVDKKERNRLAAAALREKRKEYITELESEVLTLREMVRTLKADNARLTEANGELKSHNAFLQGLMGSEHGPVARVHQQRSGVGNCDAGILTPLAESESSRKRQRTAATILCSVLASVAVVSGGTLLGPNGAAYEDGVPVSSTRVLLGTSHDVVVSPAQTSAFFSLSLCLGAIIGVLLTTLWGSSERKKINAARQGQELN